MKKGTSKGKGKGHLAGGNQMDSSVRGQMELPLAQSSAVVLAFPARVNPQQKSNDAMRRILEFADRLPS